MRIAIFGSYNGTSVGDTAILLGLLRAIGSAAPNAKVTVLSMGPIGLSRDASITELSVAPKLVRANARGFQEAPVLRSLLWRVDRWVPFSRWLGKLNIGRCRAIIEQQDLLIIGGGNLLMDLFKGHVEILSAVCDLARAANVPYAFLGVGAGPINATESRLVLSECLANARHVIVRDAASRNICRGTLGRDDTRKAPDLAFALQGAAHTDRSRNAFALNLASIGDTTWPWRDEAKYRAYVDGFIRLARAASHRCTPGHVEIISTNMSVDQRASHEVAQALSYGSTALSCPVSVVACADVTDALAAFSRADLAITTRLHAGIIAAIAGCRVLPVVYHDKVRAVLEDEGISPVSVDIASLADPAWSPDSLFADIAVAPAGLLRAIAQQVIGAVDEVLRPLC